MSDWEVVMTMAAHGANGAEIDVQIFELRSPDPDECGSRGEVAPREVLVVDPSSAEVPSLV